MGPPSVAEREGDIIVWSQSVLPRKRVDRSDGTSKGWQCSQNDADTIDKAASYCFFVCS